MNVPRILVGLGLTASLAANVAIGVYALEDHRRVNRLTYDMAHNVGDIDETRLGEFRWEYVYDGEGDNRKRVEVPCKQDPTKACYKTMRVRNNLTEIALNLDSRIHAIESRLSYFNEYDATFYGSATTQWAIKDAIRDWQAEHNPDGDYYWTDGEIPDECPDVAGDSDPLGCPEATTADTNDSLDAKAWSGTLPAIVKDKPSGTVEVVMPDGSKLSCTYQLTEDKSDYADLSACAVK